MESIATLDNAHGKETYCHCENESIGRYVAFGSTSEVTATFRNFRYGRKAGAPGQAGKG